MLERVQTGPLRFRGKDNLPFGTAWNTSANFKQGRMCSFWARDTFPDAALVSSLEIPFADARGDEVNAASARAFGRDLARALAASFADSRPPR